MDIEVKAEDKVKDIKVSIRNPVKEINSTEIFNSTYLHYTRCFLAFENSEFNVSGTALQNRTRHQRRASSPRTGANER